MTPNPKIRELIVSMGIIPESEHYDIAERVIQECCSISDEVERADTGMFASKYIRAHFGVEE